MRYVYLAGPIAGCDYVEATDWREWVGEHLLPGIVGVSPMRLKEWCQRMEKISGHPEEYEGPAGASYLISGESHAIRARDFNDVRAVDMIFAYLPKKLNERRPSWGTSIEIGWASGMQKPIVLVTDDETLARHPLVRESAGWIVPTLQLGVDVVNSTFGVYVGEAISTRLATPSELSPLEVSAADVGGGRYE